MWCEQELIDVTGFGYYFGGLRLKHEVIDEESAHVFGSDVKRLDKPHVTAGANKFEGVSGG